MPKSISNLTCPCNSNKTYALCCGVYHKGKIPAPTAEALMRSRYSAYFLGEIQYIYRSWDKKTRPSLAVLREDNSQVFTNLKIINTDDKENVNTATVEFIASYVIVGEDQIHQHHENSFFLKNKNKWRYVNEISKVKDN